MRPFKHVAPLDISGFPEYQNVLGIETVRFKAPWGEVPIVATSELDRITLFAWDESVLEKPQWKQFERPHGKLTTHAVELDDPNDWNWSRRVSVACSKDTVFLVYKRQHLQTIGPIGIGPTRLTIDRFQPDGDTLRPVDSFDLPTVPSRLLKLGFNVWADVDPIGGRLLILMQTAGILRTAESPWTLSLQTLPLDDLQDESRYTLTLIGDGGYDLDARISGRKLLAVYRQRAPAVRFPPPVAPFEITSGPESDHFYSPLALSTIDLDTLDTLGAGAVTTETLPGGEHPQIQSVNPLIITFDREQKTTVRFDTVVAPLPPHQRLIVWQPTHTDKVAIVRRQDGDARGVILSTTADILPRGFHPLGAANHLIALDDDGAPGHASPLGIFPVQLLQVQLRRKEILLDLLHHLQFIALVRTRVTGETSGDTLTVNTTAFEVWDIGHARIRTPGSVVPDAEPETRQFAPFESAHSTASTIALVPLWRLDNTMGGHVTADLRGTAASFFAYTDMGDGGLRVIFADDVAPLPDPPPNDDPKSLPPASVTGPRIPGDEWVELDAEGLIDSGLPAYPVGILTTGSLGSQPSVASALEVQLDSFLDGIQRASDQGLGPGGAPIVPFEGMTEAQIKAVDDLLENQSTPRTFEILLSDGSTLQVTVTPGLLIEGEALQFSATNGANVPSVLWSFVRHQPGVALPEGPLSPFTPGLFPATAVLSATTNPANINFSLPGQWRLSVFIPSSVAGDPPLAGLRELTVQQKTSNLIWALHDNVRAAQFEIGNLHATLLQYDFQYLVDAEGERSSVAITTVPQRATQIRFRADGNRQGFVDCVASIKLDSIDVRLKGLLGLAFAVTDLQVELLYSRPFTPGMLMVDERAFDALSGNDLGDEPDDLIDRKIPLRHAALSAKPIGDGTLTINDDALVVKIAPRPEAIVTTVIAALVVIGASALVEAILAALGLAAVAVALGIAAAIAVAAALLVILLLFVAPLVAEGSVKDTIKQKLPSIQPALDDLGFIRYAGEGVAEAIARMVFDTAVQPQGINVAPASTDPHEIGLDRFRGQTMQMIFVSDDVCRVLVRPDA